MGITFIAVRHAQPLSEGFADELLRILSQEGRLIHTEITLKMKNDGIKPHQIYSSPIIRAKETASIMGEIFGIDIVETAALGYDFNENELLSRIKSAQADQTIVMVGHEPHLAQFVNKLVGRNVLPNGLSKSSAVVVHFDDDIDYKKGKLIKIYRY